jgi:hypothetical protein
MNENNSITFQDSGGASSGSGSQITFDPKRPPRKATIKSNETSIKSSSPSVEAFQDDSSSLLRVKKKKSSNQENSLDLRNSIA